MIILIQTRWHEDDLAGRIISDSQQEGEAWPIVQLPALAERHDPLGRKPGEALWPERWNVEQLEKYRRTLGSYFFSAMYQQHPTPLEGGLFQRDWFKLVGAAPAGTNASVGQIRRVHYWDLAASLDGDYTCGVLMCRRGDGLFCVEDVQRGRWSPAQRDAVILQTAKLDGHGVEIVIEQEPGSAGKSVCDWFCKMLAGFTIHADRPTGPKEVRAQPFSAQCEAGNVCLVSGNWNSTYLDELCMFPNGTYDDQVDASAGAINRLTQYAVAYEAPKVLRVEPRSLRRFGIQFDPRSRLFRR